MQFNIYSNYDEELGYITDAPKRYCGPFGNATMVEIFNNWRVSIEEKYPAAGVVINTLLSIKVLMPSVLILV